LAHDTPPIELPEPVPQGVLCGAAADALEAELVGSGALWWHGGDLTTDRWAARLGETGAIPTDPNEGKTDVCTKGPEPGLRCQPGVHCGFVAADVTPQAASATLAIRWSTPPGQDARTLLTLNTGGAARKTQGENYLFLSETEGVLTVQDDAGRIALNVPCPARAEPHLAIVGLDGDRVTLFLDGEHHAATGSAPVLDGPASLFIAARNQRPKLLKTLGAALILDVLLWQGRSGLSGAEMMALRRYHLWAGLR
jgi:hypothetical protein